METTGTRERLDSPANDAEAIGRRLEALGFEVILETDLDCRRMTKSLPTFSRRLPEASAALFFYAGHGMQFEGRKYLFPTDAVLDSEIRISLGLVNVDEVLSLMENAGVATRLVFLDACRNNPMVRRFRSASRATRSTPVGRGVAPMDAAFGSFIAYATAPGDLAEDGQRDHSPFSDALLEHLDEPGLDVDHLLSLPELDDFRERFRMRSIDRTAGRFRDCDGCPEMIVVPSGRFEMGARSRFARERPMHSVEVASFALSRFEITFGAWKACVRDRACDAAALRTLTGDDRQPVVNVTWREAKAYTAWLSAKTNLAYRLPSEAEWEYAARAGLDRAFASGDRITTRDANFDDRRHSPGRQDRFEGRATIVGSFEPNRFGLHDMHGNVREWVEDRWHDDYRGAPVDGSAWIAATSIERVVRGGSWHDDSSWLRSAARDKALPNSRNACTGFRLARDLSR